MTDHADYFAIDAVNASSLKDMYVSPLRYHYGKTHKREASAAMRKGTAIHVATLEPVRFASRYLVYDGTRTTKEWKAFKAAAPEGSDILTSAEYEDIVATAKAVRSHPVAADYLRWGRPEQTIVWTDEATGLRCKLRADWLTDDDVCVDLKSAARIDPRSFERQTHDLLYYMSAAHYIAGLKAETGLDWSFVFIAVESGAPHDVRVGPITEDALWAGEQERTRLLRLVADCTASGEWPGAYPNEVSFDLPAWFYADNDDFMSELKLEGRA